MTKHNHRGFLITGYTVQYWMSNRIQLDSGPAFNIADTAANITAALNALNTDSHIAQIAITDSPHASVTVSVAQLTSDSTALSKLINADGSAAHLTVSDTSAHIAASFATIATEGQVTKIVVSDNAVVTLTASQTSNYLVAVSELVNANNSAASVHVKDTAANLATYLNGIESAGSAVTQIIVSNSTAMTLTAAQIYNDASALAIVVYNNGGTVQFKVNDTGASITTYLDALQAQTKIATITDNDNSAITLTVAKTVSDAGALGKIVNQNGNPYTLYVADTAGNVAGSVSALNANSHITKIEITDTAADVQTYLDTLSGITASMTIALTDHSTPTIAITDGQFYSDAGVLGDITSAYHLTVSGTTVSDYSSVLANSHVTSITISDLAANVQSALDNLEANASKISSITLTDNSPPTLTITATQYFNDATVLGEIGGSWNLNVTGATASQAGSISGAPHVNLIYVSDTGENIGPELTTLLGVVQAGHLGGITVTDSYPITTTEATYTECASVFADITSGYTVALTAVAAADASGLAGNSHITSLSVYDSAYNVQQNLDSLESVHSKIATIALDDGSTPTITITAGQFTSDAAVLNDITSAYNLSIGGATVAQALAEAQNSHVTSIAISDSAHNVNVSLDNLEAINSQIASITLTSQNIGFYTLTITETQYHGDANVLAKIVTAYALDVTNVLAADAATIAADSRVSEVFVSDTAADVQTALNSLEGLVGGKLEGITLTDGGTPTITVSAATNSADIGALRLIGSSYNLDVIGVKAASAAGVAGESAGNTHSITVSLTDNAGNVQSALDSLESVHSQIFTITLTNDTTPTLTVTDGQYFSDASVIGDIVSSYHLAVTGATVAHAITESGNGHVTSIAISDSAANVQGNLSTLYGIGGTITSITLNDSGTPVIDITESAYNSYDATLGLITNTFDITLTAVSAQDAGTLAGATINHGTVTQLYVSDNAGNIETYLANLDNADVVRADISNGGSIQINVASLEANGAALAKLYATDDSTHATVTISDTAANISGDLSGLNTDALSGLVTKIIVSDNGLTSVTIAQITNYSAALNELYQSDGVTPADLTVSDTASNISHAFDALNMASRVQQIIISDSGTVTIGAASAATDGTALGELYLTGGTTHAQVVVSDSASNVAANLGGLETNVSHISSISLNDASEPTLTVTESQLTGDTSAYDLISWSGAGGKFNVLVTGVHVADFASDYSTATSNSNADQVTEHVSDTAANVQSAFATLGNASYVTDIHLTTSDTLTLSEYHLAFANYQHVLEVIDNTSFNVALTGVGAANIGSDQSELATLNANAHLVSVSVLDTSTNVATYIDALEYYTYGNHNILSSITLTDSDAMSISETSYHGDTNALGKIQGSYTLDITSAKAADVTGLLGDSHIVGIAVNDTGGNIGSNFDALNSNTVTSIVISDAGTVTVGAQSAASDTHALLLLHSDDHVGVTVSDTAANVSTYLNALDLNFTLSFITRVDVTDAASNNVVVSVSQLTSDAAILSSLYVDTSNTHASLTVNDTASAISGDIDHLNGSQITKIIVNNSGSAEVTVDYAQLTTDSHALGELTNSNGSGLANIAVTTDTVSILEQFSTFNTDPQINKVILTNDAGNSNEVTVNVAQFTNDATALGKLYESDGVTPANIIVHDTVGNLASIFNTLNSDTQVNKIDDNAGQVTLSVSDALADTRAESILYDPTGTNPVDVAVSDTASAVAANAAAINANTHINNVYVVDSASNVAAALDNLNAVTYLTSITLNDATEPTLSITAGQLASDSSAYGKIVSEHGPSGKFNVQVIDVLAANVGSVYTAATGGNASVDQVFEHVSDTASDISTALNSLHTFASGHSGVLTTIIVSDSGSNEVTINVASLLNDGNVESLLVDSNGSTPAKIAVADTATHIAAHLSAIQLDSQIDNIYVSDSAYNISTQFDTLNGLTYLTGITINDGQPLTIGYSTLTTDTKAFGLINNASFNVAVEGPITAAEGANLQTTVSGENAHATVVSSEVFDTAANVLTYETQLNAHSFVSQVVVEDSVANLELYFDQLNAFGAKLVQIDATTFGAVTLTAQSAVNDTNAEAILFAIPDVGHVAASDTVANVLFYASQLNANSFVDAVTVVDNATNIAANFDTLNGFGSKLVAIDNTGPGEVTLSVASAINDQYAVSLLTGTDAGHVAVQDSAANILAQASFIGTNGYIDHINVVDNTANISSNFDALNNFYGKLANIDNTGPGEVTVSAYDAVTDTYAEAVLTGTDAGHVAVSDTVANVVSYESQIQTNSAIDHVIVADTASNIGNNFQTLNGLSNLSAIQITDGGDLVLSYSSLTAYAQAFGLINNPSFNVAITGATAAEAVSLVSTVYAENANATVVSTGVTDSGANVSFYLDQLNGISSLAAINITSGALVITEGQLHGPNADLVALRHIATSNFTLDVTNVLASDASSVQGWVTSASANANLQSISVTDDAANIAAAFGSLNSTAHITAIIVSDSGSNEVTLSASAAVADTTAESHLYLSNGSTPAHVAVSDTAGNVAISASGINGNAHIDNVYVTDTAGNIASNFGGLNSVTALTKIVVSDSAENEVTLNVVAALADTNAESHLYQSGGSSHADVAVSDSAANVANNASDLNANGHIDHVYVVDSGYNVESNIPGLSEVNNLAVTLTVGNTAMSFTDDQFVTATTVIGEVTNSSFTVGVTGVTVDQLSTVMSDYNGFGNSAHINLLVSIADNAANVAGAVTTLNDNSHIWLVQVTDTAENVSTYIDPLNGVNNLDIHLSNDDTLTITEDQLDNDHNSIGAIDNGSFNVTVTGVQANEMAGLQAELTAVNGHAHLSNISISDTAANISGNFNALNSNSVNYIQITDSGTGGVVTIDVAQSGDTHALSVLHNDNGTSALVTVADTSGNISVAFDTLIENPYVNKFDLTDNGPLTISAVDGATYSGLFTEFFNANGTTPATIEVTDKAGNISQYFDDLSAAVGNGLSKIIVTDSGSNEVMLRVGQLTTDASAIGHLYDTNGSMLADYAVLDTAANIAPALDSLNGNSRVDHIIISDDRAITLGAASAVNDTHALNELSNYDHSPVTLIVNDNSGNIATYLDQLNSITTVSSIVIADNGTLTLAAEQMRDASALSKLSNADHSGVTIDVYDTGANISEYLSYIAANSNDVQTITDSDNAALTVTVAELTTYPVILSEITNNDGITPATVDVLDTAANIEAHIDDLNGNPTPQAIIISDNLALAMTVHQYTHDTSLLLRLQNADHSPYMLDISDNGANISGALDSLGNDSHIVSITDTNEAAITLNIAQITSDASALSKLVNGDGSPYTLSVNDNAGNITTGLNGLEGNTHVADIVVTDSPNEVVVSVAQVTSDAYLLAHLYTDPSLTTLANYVVSDTAANLSGTALGLLDTSRVDHIIVNDGPANEVTLSVSEYHGDTAQLAELVDSSSNLALLAINDTAAHLSGTALGLLDTGRVDRIIVNDSGSGNEVTLTVGQYGSDGGQLAELYKDGSYNTLANVAINDTAANLSYGALGSLHTSRVDHIVVNDTGLGNEVNLSVSQYGGDTAQLAELYTDGTYATLANVAINDSASNLSFGALGSLDTSRVDHIIVNDSGISEVTLSAAEYHSDTAQLAELWTDNTYTTLANVAVSDTAANLSGNVLGSLNTSRVDNIIVNDGPGNEVTLSVGQYNGDTAQIAELYDTSANLAYLAVVDTAQNLSGDVLGSLDLSRVDHIVVSDSGLGNEVTLNVGQYNNDYGASLSVLYTDNSYNTLASVVVSDTAGNLSYGVLGSLDTSRVDHIIVNDSGLGNEVALNVAQYGADGSALSELYTDGSYNTLAKVAINDTAGNLSYGALGSLDTSRVDHIIVNDSGVNEVALTVAQYGADGTALSELYTDGSYTTLANVVVNDTAANLSYGGLGSLDTGRVDHIVVNDSGLNEVTLTVGQYGNDTAQLSELYTDGSYNTLANVAINDTAGNLSGDALGSLDTSRVDHIIVSDSGLGNEVTLSDYQYETDGAQLSKLYTDNTYATQAHVVVADYAGNISNDFDNLSGDSQVNKIVVTDSGSNEVVLADYQTHENIGKLYNADGNTQASVIVADLSANISSDFDHLNGLGQVNKIIATDDFYQNEPEVTISDYQLHHDTTALAELYKNDGVTLADVRIYDAAANLSGSEFDYLNNDGRVNGIIISDGGTVTISAVQALNDTTALNELFQGDLSIPATVEVLDTAANIQAQLDNLNGNLHVSDIHVTDTPDFQLSAVQVGTDTRALGLIDNVGVTIEVTDTAANISQYLDALNGNSDITSITISDNGAITVDVSQYQNDTVTLDLLQNQDASPVTLVVRDTADHISADLGGLGDSQITSIVISDNAALTLNVSEFLSDGTELAKVHNDNGSNPAVLVSDSSSQVQGNLDDLQSAANAFASSSNGTLIITLTDATEPTLTITDYQFSHDAGVLSDITGAYHLAVTSVAAADALGISQNSHVTSIAVYDDAVDVGTSLDQLETVASGSGGYTGTLTIVLSDLTEPTFTISETQYHNDSKALGDISSPFQIAVTDVAAADALSISGDSRVVSIAVYDNAGNVGANLDHLETVASGSYTGGLTIALSNPGTAISISETSYNNDSAALADITTGYALAVTGVAATDALAISGDSHVVSIAVSDSASNVQSALGELEQVATGNSGAYTGTLTISLDDHSAPTMTLAVSTVESDAAAFAVISAAAGSYTLDVTNALISDITTVEGQTFNGAILSFAVSDSAADVQADLRLGGSSVLKSYVASISSISLNDGSAPTIALFASTVESDASVFAKISAAAGSYTLDVNRAAISDVSTIGHQTFNGAILSFAVTDSAADVQTDLLLGGSSVLKGYISEISGISLNDGSAPTITLSASLVEYDANVFAKISAHAGSYTLDVTSALVTDITTIEGQSFNNATLSFAVSDSAADVQADLRLGGSSVLKGYISSISSISLSDGSAPTIALFASTVESDASVFAKIVAAAGSYTLDVNHAAISDITTVEGQTFHGAILSFAVTDTTADVQTDLALGASGVLESYAASISSITLTGSGPNPLTLTEAAYNADSAALGKIVSPYTLSITNALAGDAASIAQNTHVTSISVYDTGANISLALDALNTNADVTAIVISDNAALVLSVHSAIADSHALGLLSNANHTAVSLTIDDTAANIGGNLNALNAIATISSIVISDNAALSLSASQVANDASALAKTTNANGQPITINVADLAANISTYIDQLEQNNYIGTITVLDNAAVVVSTTQLANDADALAALVNANNTPATVTVRDTGANVSNDLANLNADTQVTSIVISDNAQLNLKVAQVVGDGRALGELSNANHTNVTEKVTDTALNIQTYLDNLQADAQINSVVVSNNVALTLTAEEVAHDGTVLAEITNRNGGAVTFVVSDTGANISTYLNQLASSAQFSKITSITVSDNASVTLSVAQMASDAAVLAKLVNQNSSPYTLTVNDLAANLSFGEFNTLNGNSHVTSIVISDNGPLSLTISEFTNDTHALAELSNANGQPYSITIVDTAQNIAPDLSVLNGNSHVHKIVVSDNGTITLSASQAVGDATALGEMYQANGTSQFLTSISDSSANLSTYLNALQGLAADLGAITISDYGNLSVNVAQILADATVLGKMHYLSGQLYEVNLTDTAANISANIAALGANGRVESIVVSDNGVVTSTYALYNEYSSMFYNIQGTHYLDITNVTGKSYASFTETINGSHQVTLQDFYDSNGNILSQIQFVYNQDGTETIYGSDISGQAYASYVQNLNAQHELTSATYYYGDGSVYENQTFTYNQDGSVNETITGAGLGGNISSETILTDSHGNDENKFIYYTNNTQTAYFYETGQTFNSVSGESISINILNGTTGDTFDFNGTFGKVAIYGYVPGSETINFDHNDFANIAAVEAHTQAYGSTGTQVVLDGHDVIILMNVSVAQFESHTGDWHFI